MCDAYKYLYSSRILVLYDLAISKVNIHGNINVHSSLATKKKENIRRKKEND